MKQKVVAGAAVDGGPTKGVPWV